MVSIRPSDFSRKLKQREKQGKLTRFIYLGKNQKFSMVVYESGITWKKVLDK